VKIIVDRARCAGLGVCESFAPEIFKVNGTGALVLGTDTVPDGRLEDVEDAVASCPTEALRMKP
jgi:ferredoxin